jgi:hypothetical protein
MTGTPMDLTRLIDIRQPVRHPTYAVAEYRCKPVAV